jgi:NAD(P)-dependent dehydrogenase (short-subunit alcohol dehydrogenase family)
MNGLLEGKVAIITGATSGIGESAAALFAVHGAIVVIAGRNQERGGRIAQRLGEQVFYRPADITVEADLQSLATWTHERFGRIDCLFNNAGGSTPSGNIENVTTEMIGRGLDLLLTSVFLMCKAVAPFMKRQMSGSIINNASVAGSGTGYAGLVYSTAKGGVIQLSRYLAAQLAPFNIRVNSLSPGMIATPIFAANRELADEELRQVEAIVREWGSKYTPLGRAGEPEDIAGPALFLASDLSSFMTGQDLIVDGGLTGGWTIRESEERYAELNAALRPYRSV